MADLDGNPRRLDDVLHGNQVDTARKESAGVEFLIAADNHLPGVSLALAHVERRSGRYAQALALTHGKVVNAAVLAHDLPARGHALSAAVAPRSSALREIGITEALVISAWNNADSLGGGLLGSCPRM